MYLNKKASVFQLRAAVNAQRNRLEIVKAISQGQVSRRELLKWGLFTAGGALALKHGLNPFVGNVYATEIPTGMPPSPLFGIQAFTQPLRRCDVMKRSPISFLNSGPIPPRRESNQTKQTVHPDLGGGEGPIEGRPPGPDWAHQGWDLCPPQIGVEAWTKPARTSPSESYNPEVIPALNSGINAADSIPCRFHPGLPVQSEKSFWSFDGTVPLKLLQARYGEPILFRHHNALPTDATRNGGFGRHTTTTHEHNGHHGAESDGFTGAYFFPNQFYDYHWPIVHAGFKSINLAAADARCGAPNGSGGIVKLPGDWRETMSTHWFHDHTFSFTSQNVYKGMAAMLNIYSSIDRGNESINDGVNLQLPSGNAKDWGNLEYDVNLMFSDKAFDRDGQLVFDIFDFDGFLGDIVVANNTYKPYFEVQRRKYRFRLMNGSVARFFKLALSDGSTMIQIGNDGNLLPQAVALSESDQMGVGERYDVVIDFARYRDGDKVYFVNLAEHQNGRRVAKDLTLREALSGQSDDPGVGKIFEFRILGPSVSDPSQVPRYLIPNPDLSRITSVRQRTFEFGRSASQSSTNSVSAGLGPWGTAVDRGNMLAADFNRISSAPKAGTREIWTLVNGGGGWDHPIHIHFEEGQILARDGKFSNVPLWERGRKDVYRLRPGGSITITMQFRDWGGMFMEHCHNTVHEDNAMLLRWDVNAPGGAVLKPLPTPIPTPQGVTWATPTTT